MAEATSETTGPGPAEDAVGAAGGGAVDTGATIVEGVSGIGGKSRYS